MHGTVLWGALAGMKRDQKSVSGGCTALAGPKSHAGLPVEVTQAADQGWWDAVSRRVLERRGGGREVRDIRGRVFLINCFVSCDVMESNTFEPFILSYSKRPRRATTTLPLSYMLVLVLGSRTTYSLHNTLPDLTRPYPTKVWR